MDYELKIKQLEEETRHWRAMQELHKGSLDAHGRSISALDDRLDRVETNLDVVSSQLKSLVAAQSETDRMLRDLIQALTPHSNGKS